MEKITFEEPVTLSMLKIFDIDQLNKLRDDFQFMTEQMMKKTMQHANKQLQDTLMNYFLENYVSAILKRHLGKSTNRSVREMLDQNLSKDYPKYMSLLIKFEDKIEEVGQIESYEKMLIALILDNKDYSVEGADQWKTHTRKRMLALMLYCHLKLKDQREVYPNFFELWKLIYPANPLPQRVARSAPSGTISVATKSPSCSPKNQNGTRIESFETSTQCLGQQSSQQISKKQKKVKGPEITEVTKKSDFICRNNNYENDLFKNKKIKLNNQQEQIPYVQQTEQFQAPTQQMPVNTQMVNPTIQYYPVPAYNFYQPQVMIPQPVMQPNIYGNLQYMTIPQIPQMPFGQFNYIQQPVQPQLINFMMAPQPQQQAMIPQLQQ